MLTLIFNWLKSLFGAEGTTQVGKGNIADSFTASTAGNNSPITFDVRTAGSPESSSTELEESRVLEFRRQIATLSKSESLVLKEMLKCGELTEQRAADFCRQQQLEFVDLGALEQKITFIQRNPVSAGRYIDKAFAPIAFKVLSEE